MTFSPVRILLTLCFFATLCVAAPHSVLAQTGPDASPVPDDPGLYVVVEAASRPLDALMVLPPVCTMPKASCDLVEFVIGNDTRLSGLLRPLHASAAQAASVTKTPLPAFTTRNAAAQAAGATYVIASALKPAKAPGLVDLTVTVIDVRDGKQVELGDWAHQVGPLTGLRSMAHRVLNAIQGALTGVEGSFDSVIFYGAPGPGCQRCIWQVDADGFGRRVLVGDPGIHMFPVQLLDGGLAYTSFRTGMPSLFKMDAAQLGAVADMSPILSKKAKKPGAAPDKPTPTVPFAAGPDLQFRGCAQNSRGDLVATINDGEQADIYRIDYTGLPSTNLTHNEHDDLGPSYSPDGSHIAFVSDRIGTPQVYVMDWDGSNQRRLTFVGPYNTDPDWGPDGRIAYSGMRGNAIDILTVDLQGHTQRLTPGQGRRSLEPSWSPDGKRLVYASNEDGKGMRLWVTSSDGAAREPLDVPFGKYYTPSWQRMPGKTPRRFDGRSPGAMP